MITIANCPVEGCDGLIDVGIAVTSPTKQTAADAKAGRLTIDITPTWYRSTGNRHSHEPIEGDLP